MANPLQQLRELGQSVWLDSIRRSYLQPGGYLPQLIDAEEIDGLTSNPTIFERALAEDVSYRDQLAQLAGSDPREALWALIKADVRAACDLFLPLYRASDRTRGFVSIEVDPAKAFDTEETVAEALLLFRELDRPNLMVKVPGTEAGLPAISRLLAEGVNVNVTLLFAVARYEAVAAAYLEGLRRRAERDDDLASLASVASFFVSRVDSKVDALLGEGHPQLATAGIANARVAYESFQRVFAGPEFAGLAAAGGRVQRPLWGSTSTKNPAYPDVLYVAELAGPDTVDTMPEATLDAFRDHGTVEDRLTGSGGEARRQLQRLAEQGVDLDQVTKELEAEGVEKFVASFEAAVRSVEGQLPG
ncbi:MAG TPA: transaldolase [Egibacteraceae bacterium]|nr:transaldolase [Actinomycetota bacterium]HWB70782.1 transaldolase [Egibacteraceae bacterium]